MSAFHWTLTFVWNCTTIHSSVSLQCTCKVNSCCLSLTISGLESTNVADAMREEQITSSLYFLDKRKSTELGACGCAQSDVFARMLSIMTEVSLRGAAFLSVFYTYVGLMEELSVELILKYLAICRLMPQSGLCKLSKRLVIISRAEQHIFFILIRLSFFTWCLIRSVSPPTPPTPHSSYARSKKSLKWIVVHLSPPLSPLKTDSNENQYLQGWWWTSSFLRF